MIECVYNYITQIGMQRYNTMMHPQKVLEIFCRLEYFDGQIVLFHSMNYNCSCHQRANYSACMVTLFSTGISQGVSSIHTAGGLTNVRDGFTHNAANMTLRHPLRYQGSWTSHIPKHHH